MTAVSAAAEGVKIDDIRIVAGHKVSGISDAYLKRSPQTAAASCEAVRRHYGIDNPKANAA